jgi:uroporphyrinogen decarboxylase
MAVLSGERRDPPPVWIMRQAGRYLPEYRRTRAAAGGFLNMVYAPEIAAEITLQPIRRFGMDGAILFSDILIVAHALGQELTFVEGEGPRLAPPLAAGEVETLTPAYAHFDPIYATVARVREALGPETALIGFAGAPWTVATYMVAGQGSREEARVLAYRDPVAFARLIDRIVMVTIDYLSGQIAAGAQTVKIFDSWAGALAADEFVRWSVEPTARIVEAVHARYPGVPIIGFPRGAGEKIVAYARETGVDALAIDDAVDPDWAHANLPPALPVQGNLDNLALLNGGEALEAGVTRIRRAFAARPHIFNLGHGVLPQTPVAHMEQLLAAVRRRL